MCNGYHENCNCQDCEYANMLYAELDFLESYEPSNKREIERITNELESMGYTV